MPRRNRCRMSMCRPVPRGCPADEGEELQAERADVVALAARRPVDVRLGPLLAPDVLVVGSVEGRGAEPVLQGEFLVVLDPHPPLLRRVDEEEPAQGPERLPAEVVSVLLLDDDDPAAGLYPPIGKGRC